MPRQPREFRPRPSLSEQRGPKRGGKPGARGGKPDARGARPDQRSPQPGRRIAKPDLHAPKGGRRPAPRGGRRGGAPEAAEKAALWTPGPDARIVRTERGQDLAHFLVNHANGRLSVRAARRLLEGGGCRINGKVETFGSRVLQYGEVVEFFVPEDREHRFDRRRVLFDNVGVLAYDKPPFLPVTPTDGPKSWSLYDILKAQFGELHAVHRLDADTSGIVLFARTELMAKRLEAMFRDHAVHKTYHAIVRGHPPEAGERRSYLVKVESRRGFEKWMSGRGADAREAVTAWRVAERLGRYASLVEVEPRTGRHHQIRIHFSEMDFPLYGDRIYSDRQDPVHCMRHMLHASRVRLPHPAGGPSIDIQAPLPAEFAEAAIALRKL